MAPVLSVIDSLPKYIEHVWHGTCRELPHGIPNRPEGNWFAMNKCQSMYYILSGSMEPGSCTNKLGLACKETGQFENALPRLYQYQWKKPKSAHRARLVHIQSVDDWHALLQHYQFDPRRFRTMTFSSANQEVATAMKAAGDFDGWVMPIDQTEVMLLEPHRFLNLVAVYRFNPDRDRQFRRADLLQKCQEAHNVARVYGEMKQADAAGRFSPATLLRMLEEQTGEKLQTKECLEALEDWIAAQQRVGHYKMKLAEEHLDKYINHRDVRGMPISEHPHRDLSPQIQQDLAGREAELKRVEKSSPCMQRILEADRKAHKSVLAPVLQWHEVPKRLSHLLLAIETLVPRPMRGISVYNATPEEAKFVLTSELCPIDIGQWFVRVQ